MDGLGAGERRERGSEGGGRKRGSRKKEEWEERECRLRRRCSAVTHARSYRLEKGMGQRERGGGGAAWGMERRYGGGGGAKIKLGLKMAEISSQQHIDRVFSHWKLW